MRRKFWLWRPDRYTEIVTFYLPSPLKALDLNAFRLLLENAAVKQARVQRAPMIDGWHLVLVCAGGEYALCGESNEPMQFPRLDEAVALLEAEGLSVAALTLGVRT